MLRLPEDGAARIRRHGEAEYPRECCGFLVGRHRGDERDVVRVIAAVNQRDDSPENRYLVSPEAYLAAETEADRDGLAVVGFYHSHPDVEARPSEFDRSHALPGCSYAIVAVRAGKASDLRSWILSEDRSAFREEPLAVFGRTA